MEKCKQMQSFLKAHHRTSSYRILPHRTDACFAVLHHCASSCKIGLRSTTSYLVVQHPTSSYRCGLRRAASSYFVEDRIQTCCWASSNWKQAKSITNCGRFQQHHKLNLHMLQGQQRWEAGQTNNNLWAFSTNS